MKASLQLSSQSHRSSRLATFAFQCALLLALLIPTGRVWGQQTATIGDGTSTNYYPMPGFYGWQYDVYLYTPSAASFLNSACTISSIAWNISSGSTSSAQMTIWVKDVDLTTLSSSSTFSSFTSGATQVYSGSRSTTTGWNTYNFSTNFSHQAGKALLVAVRGVGCSTSGGCSRYCYYTSATSTHWYKRADGSTDPGTSVTGSVDGNRSNIQVTYTTANNSYIPMYTFYCDYGFTSEYILPASYFSEKGIANGSSLNSITFYQNTTDAWVAKNLTIKLTNTTTSSYSSTGLLGSSGTTVYTNSSYSANSAESHTFTFNTNTPFTYTGGNLIVQVSATSGGTYKSTTWQGQQTTTNQGYYTYGSSNTAGSLQMFIPRTTFTYTLPSYTISTSVSPSSTGSVTGAGAYTFGNSCTLVATANNGYVFSNWTENGSVVSGAGATYTFTVSGNRTLTANFITDPCIVTTLPWSENFEGYSSGLPTCWTHIGNGTATSQSSYPYNSSYCLKFSGATSDNIVVLPPFEREANTLQISFWTRPEGTSSSGNFDFGYVTNASDASTFQSLETYNCSMGTTYVQGEILLNTLPNGARLAFRHRSGSTSWYWFVDDILVEEIPSCLKPSNLTITATTTNSAAINWTASGHGEAGYEYITVPADQTPNWNNATYTANTSALLTGLDNYSKYDVYVRSACGNSDYSNPISTSFHTELDCGDNSNFNQFAIGTGTGTTYYSPFYSYSYSSYVHAASWQIYTAEELSNYIEYGGNIRGIAWKTTSTTAAIPFQIYMATTDRTSFVNSTDTVSRANMTLVYDGTTAFTANEWTEIIFNQPFHYDGNSNLLIMVYRPAPQLSSTVYFNYTSTSSSLVCYRYGTTSALSGGGSYSTSRINTRFTFCEQIPSCHKPTNLTASDITPTRATLSWTQHNGTSTNWILQYGTDENFSEGTYSEVNVSGTPSKLLAGLTTETPYYARVKADCGGGDESDWSRVCEFTPTSCKTSGTGTSTQAMFPVVTNYKNSYGQIIYTPSEVGNTGLIEKIKFNSVSANTYTRNIHIYMGTTTKSAFTSNTDFVEFSDLTEVYSGSWDITADLNEFTLSTPFEYDGSSNLILAIYSTASNYNATNFYSTSVSGYMMLTAYSDSYDPDPETYDNDWSNYSGSKSNTYTNKPNTTFCFEVPITCPVPTDFTNNDVTASTADLSWTPGGDENAWRIAYTTDPDDVNSFTYIDVTDNSYTLEGLAASTTYFAFVRANCGNDDLSDWTSAINFTTDDACTPNPSSVDGDGITNVTFGSGDYIVNNNTSEAVYADYTSEIGAVQAGVPSTIAITYATGYDYGTIIWIDFDNNSNFEDSEIAYVGMSGSNNPTTLNASITIPANQPTGDYIMRIGGSDSDFDDYINGTSSTAPDPCYSGSWACFQDYTLRVLEAPSCIPPTNFAANNITTNSAELSWTEVGAATTWQVCLDGDEDNLITVTTNPYTLTGLTANTTYAVKVRAYCSSSDQSDWSIEETFTTKCDAYDVPYTYGFETADEFDCWTPVSGSVTRMSGTTNTGSYRLDFRGTTSNMIALPQFTEPTNTLRVEFYTRPETASGSSGKFAIGYMTDISDASTFVAVETYNSTDMTTSYVQKIVDLIDVPANANIAMRQFDCSTYYYWYVDDIVVTFIPTCDHPTDLAADNFTTTSAQLSWTANSDETTWQLCIDDDEDNLITVTTNPYTLTGLTANTTYAVKVRAYCSSSDQSEWSTEKTFTTKCEVGIELPWTENFESYNSGDFTASCWVNEHIEGTGTQIFKIYTYTNGSNSTHQLQLPDMSSGTMTKLVLPGFILPNENYQFSLDVYRNSSSSNYGEGIRVYASTNGEIEGATELAFISRSYTTSDGNLIPAESASGWYTYELPIGISGTCYIILRGESKYGSSTYMDNFKIDAMPTCPKPTDLAADNITANSAELSWTENGTATAWQICLNGDEDNLIDATTNPYTLTELSAHTTYTAKVRAYCDENDQSEWANTTITFTTECGGGSLISNNGCEDFEVGCLLSEWTNEGAASWTVGTGDNTSSTGAHTGNYNAKINHITSGNVTYLVSPAIDFSNAESASLSFAYINRPWSSDIDGFGVYYRVNEGDWNELFSTTEAHSTWTEETIELAGLAANYQIGFKFTDGYGYGVGLDDICISTTIQPVSLTVTGGEWDYNGNAHAATVEVSPSVENGTTLQYSTTSAEGPWSNDVPSITDAGTLTVHVKATNPNYLNAIGSCTLTVNPISASVTIVGNTDTKTYNGNSQSVSGYEITNISSNLYTEDDFTFSGTDATARTDAGTSYMGLSANNFENTNNNFSNITFNVTDGYITITPKAATIAANNANKVYGAQDPDLTAEVTGTVGNDALTYTLIRAEGENVGTYTITVTASADDNPNYSITTTNGTFTITPATVTVTADNKSKTYGDADPDLTWTAEGFQNNDDENMLTVSISRAEGEAAGTYTITPSGATTQGNYNVVYTTGTFTIDRAKVNVIADNKSKTYGAADPELTWTAEGLRNNDTEEVLTVSISRADGETVGEYTITPSGAATQGNYTVEYETGTFTINAKTATIAANNDSKTYGDDDPTLTAEVTGVLEGDELTYTLSREEGESVGNYTITVTASADANTNYSITTSNGTFTITPKAATIAANNANKVYGEEDPDLTAEVSGIVGNDVLTYELEREEGEDVDTYTISVVVSADDNPNYSITTTNGTFTITPATVTVTADDNEKTYGDIDPDLTWTVEGLQNDDDDDVLTVSISRAEGEAAGTYTITPTGAAVQGNYNVLYENGTFTINRATATVTAVDNSKVYGTADPELTADVTGLQNNDDASVISYTISRAEGETVGEYTITPSGAATQGNYTVEYETGTFTITPASVTVNIVGNYNAEDYDGEEHTVSGYTISSIMMGEEETELYTEDDFTYSGDAMVSSTNAGTTYMGLSAEDFENNNTNFTNVTFNIVSDGYITINPISAVVTITGTKDTVDYDGEEHTATGYTAIANTELYDVGSSFEFGGTASATRADVGTTYMGLTSDDFTNTNGNFSTVTFNVTDGNITINPVGVVVTIVGHTEEADYDGNAHTVNGYDVTSILIGEEETELYTTNDFTFNGTASATRTNVVEGEDADGTTNMGLTADMFANINTNFTDVTFNVTDGYQTITPITATVTIVGNHDIKDFDGEEHSVNGYEVTSIMVGEEETELYTTNDFTFSGTASASRTNVVEGEDTDGTTNMGLTADMFANINTNFTDVTFNVTDGYQTITPITATVTIVGNHDIKDFDGEEHAVNGYEVTSIMVGEEETELYTEDDFTFSGTASAARTDAGTTNMNLTEGQFTNNNTNFSTVTFDITDGYITINAVDAIVTIVGSVDTVTYDGTEHTVTHYTATANTDLYDVEEDFTFTPGETSTIVEDEIAATRTDVGTTYMGLTDDMFENTNENFANVTFTVTDGHITVNPAAITITADENGKVYGAAEPTTLTATVEGVPESGVDPVYTVSRAEGEDVGEYPITVTPSADANPNYTITTVGGVFTITPATVTVTADNKSKVYGTEDPDLTWTAEGFQNNDNEEMLTVSITRAEGNYVGDYTITPSGDAVQGNYNVEYVTGTFSILPTVVFTTNPMPTAICSEGSISIAFDATIAGDNGEMTFAWSRNHTDDVTGAAEGTGDIEELTLTTATTQTVTFSVIPTFTPTEGEEVTGEAVTFDVVVNALPAVTATHTNVSCDALGSATLTVTNGDAPLTCLWNNETFELTADGDNYSVTFNSLTGGEYPYVITNTNSCVTSGTITVEDPGRITVSQSANSETCEKTGITVAYEIEGGTEPYTLTWVNTDNETPVEETEVSTLTDDYTFTLPEGEYRLALIITDTYGCSSTSDDILEVTVWPNRVIEREITVVGGATYEHNGVTYTYPDVPEDETEPGEHGCESTIHYVVNQYTLGISIADNCTLTRSSYTRAYSNTPHTLYGDTIYVRKNNPATFYAYINDTEETMWNEEKMDMSYELLFNESEITEGDMPNLVSNFSISSYYDRTGLYYGIPNLTAATGEIPNNTLAFRQTANSTILHFDYFYFAAFKNVPNKVTLTGLENGTYTLKLKAELRHSTGGTNRAGIYNPYIVGRKYGHLWGGYNDRPGNREVIAARTFTIIVNETGTNPNGAPMAVNEYAEGASVMAFPNPVNDQLNLRINGMSGATVITITDAQGKVVRTLNTELYGGEEVLTYSVADFAQGMYFINVRNSDTLVSEKFVVTRR